MCTLFDAEVDVLCAAIFRNPGGTPEKQNGYPMGHPKQPPGVLAREVKWRWRAAGHRAQAPTAVLIADADADVLGRMASTACWPSRLRVHDRPLRLPGGGGWRVGYDPSDFRPLAKAHRGKPALRIDELILGRDQLELLGAGGTGALDQGKHGGDRPLEPGASSPAAK